MPRIDRAEWVSLAALVLTGALGLTSCKGAGPSQEAPGPSSQVDPVARGKYLVTIVGCNDCHSPLQRGPSGPQPDMARMLSGHPESMKMPRVPAVPQPWLWIGAATNTAYAGPLGVTYATNLTPDENTGIGIWTEDMFVRALKTGKHMGTSRTIQPPMPWPWYGHMADEDLKAIYAYLRSIPPIKNQVPDYEEPAPGGR